MEQKNTIVCHCCGGMGINVADKVIKQVSEYGEGFANIEFHYLDTSRANIEKIKPLGEFFPILSSKLASDQINGSGGRRDLNATEITKAINQYIDQNKLTKKDNHRFHLVVSSASGGSGSVLSPVLINKLLENDQPVICLLVGDSSNGMLAINTKDSISSLDAIAKRNKKPLLVIYLNNHAFFKGNMKEAEQDVNNLIFNYLSSLALFLSSENEYLDNQDMINMVDQSKYTKIPLESGIYGLQFFSKEIKLPNGTTPVGGRTLTLENGVYDTGLELFHHKYGFVKDDQAKTMYEAQWPLHMIAINNYFVMEEDKLDKISESVFTAAANVKSKEIKGTSRSNIDEETGLIL